MAEENGYKPTYDPLMNHLLFGKQAQQPAQNWASVISQLGQAIIQRNQQNASPGLISDALSGIYGSTDQTHDASQDGAGLLPAMYANATDPTQQGGLLPSTNWQANTPTTDNVGSGLLNLQSPAPNYNNLTGQTMATPSVGAQVLQGKQPQATQGFTPQQTAPSAQSISAPPLTAQQGTQGVQLPSTGFNTQQTAPTASDIQNPMATDDAAFHNNPVTITQPSTPQEAQKMITQGLLKAQGDLAAKGVSSAVSGPILMQAAQQKMADYQQQFKQQQMQGALATLNNPKADDRSAAMSAMQLAQMGVKVPAGFIQAFKNPALSHVVVNAGGQQVLKSFNPKTGQFTDGGSIDVTNTPYQSGQLAIGQQNADSNATRAQASMISANRPRSNGQEKAAKVDPYWTNYQNHGGLEKDQETLDNYNNASFHTPAETAAATAAHSRAKQYYTQATGGQYSEDGDNSGGGQLTPQSVAASNGGQSNQDGAAWYDQQVRQAMQQYGVDQATAEQAVSQYITANGG